MFKLNILCITDPNTHLPTSPTIEIYRYLSTDQRFNLFHATPQLIIKQQSIIGVQVKDLANVDEFYTLANIDPEELLHDSFDLVFVRADRPYPENFLETLVRYENQFNFINRPSGVSITEKRSFYHEHCSRFLPPSVYTRDKKCIIQFISEHRQIVIKKEGSYGGKGLAFAKYVDSEILLEITDARKLVFSSKEKFAEFLLRDSEDWISFNKFLLGAKHGDKRVIVLDGQVLSQFIRKSVNESLTHNITTGGIVIASDLTTKEALCIQDTFIKYSEQGVRILGYDFLQDEHGEWVLSEINCGNVGGFKAIKELYGLDGIQVLIDWIFEIGSKTSRTV